MELVKNETKLPNIRVLWRMQGGGGFAMALSKAWMLADDGNSRRLMLAFGDLYRKYELLVEKKE